MHVSPVEHSRTWQTHGWLLLIQEKTLSLIFSRKMYRPHHPPLLINNTMLTETGTHRHLGLALSNTCTWSEHTETITTKAWARLNLLLTLKFRISRKSLEKCTYLSYAPC